MLQVENNDESLMAVPKVIETKAFKQVFNFYISNITLVDSNMTLSINFISGVELVTHETGKA